MTPTAFLTWPDNASRLASPRLTLPGLGTGCQPQPYTDTPTHGPYGPDAAVVLQVARGGRVAYQAPGECVELFAQRTRIVRFHIPLNAEAQEAQGGGDALVLSLIHI